ncbi:MAG TPA: hypothetical protein VFQ53_33905 [Kofleriaceae bacterium]|nr:hypothetical protein [Kofleriaceae bacterium]
MRWALALAAVACGSRPAPVAPPPEHHVEPAPATPPPPRRDFAVPSPPRSLVVTGDAVVWADTLGAIWTMPVTGGEPAQLSDPRTAGIANTLVVAGDRVLATSRRGLLDVRVPGGPVTKLAVSALPDQPESCAADSDSVYLTIFKRDEVVRVPVAGGTLDKLATAKRAVLAVHADTLYLASYTTGTLSALPVGGGRPRTIATGLAHPTALVVDDRHAYIYGEADRTVRRVELATGTSSALADGLDNADVLVLDGDWLYTRTWGNGGRGRVLAIARDGSRPTKTIAEDLGSPSDIAADAHAIYVTTRDDRAMTGSIVRFEKSAFGL